MDLSICIVSWNVSKDLASCLTSLYAQDCAITFETIVVDNASDDDTVRMLAQRFPQVSVIANTDNLGFAAANNQAIRIAKGRYVMLLNPDTTVHDGALDTAVRFMDQHPDVGIAGLKLIYPDGSLQLSCRSFPNPWAALWRGTPLARLCPNNRFAREYTLADWAHDEVRDVDWVSGAAMVVRREAIDQAGLLDERFFMYSEDVDWCKRMWDAGWRVTYLPDAVVTHIVGRSSDHAVIPMVAQAHRSMYRLYLKHFVGRWPSWMRPLEKAVIGAGVVARASLIIGGELLRRAVRAMRAIHRIPQQSI